MSSPHFTDWDSVAIRRLDTKAPLLVFAALFIAAVAICGTLESRSMGLAPEEVRALNQENVAGPIDVELIADCQRGKEFAADSTLNRHCRESSARKSSHYR